MANELAIERENLNSVCWADSSLERIIADYDGVLLEVTEDGGRMAQLVVSNHISCRWDGHWDENIIESADLTESSPLLNETMNSIRRRYGEHPEPGGGKRDISSSWFHLTIRLIDGAQIEVLGQRLEVRFLESN